MSATGCSSPRGRPPACLLGHEAAFAVHTHVREGAITLYGFASSEERTAFELLLGAHGVGPGLALAILSIHDPSELAEVIATGNVDALKLVPGVGPEDRRHGCCSSCRRASTTSASTASPAAAPRRTGPAALGGGGGRRGARPARLRARRGADGAARAARGGNRRGAAAPGAAEPGAAADERLSEPAPGDPRRARLGCVRGRAGRLATGRRRLLRRRRRARGRDTPEAAGGLRRPAPVAREARDRPRGRPPAGPARRPRAVRRAAGPRQDDARGDHGLRDGRRLPGHLRARRSCEAATSPPS